VPIENVETGGKFISYPQCQRLGERISSGTCDCTNTQRGRFVWFTSLHLACYYGQLEIVKCLMRFSRIAGQLKETVLLTPLMVSLFIILLYAFM